MDERVMQFRVGVMVFATLPTPCSVVVNVILVVSEFGFAFEFVVLLLKLVDF